MKQLFFSYLFICCTAFIFSQEKTEVTYVDINYFTGNIARHNDDILHLIKGHPFGFIASWNKKTFGAEEWQQLYNYPDIGLSFSYQDLQNPILGENYSLYGHANFYFLKRNLMLRIGQGLTYNTNPYHKEKNFRNIAFGSQIMSATYVMLNYKKEKIFKQFGFQTGISLLHNSNANFKAPNASINSIAANIGITYSLNIDEPEYIESIVSNKYQEPIRFNFVFRSGINESDIIDSGQYPFYIFSAYADKRISKKSSLQFGTDIFYSNFLKELIKYRFIAFPEIGLKGDEDYKRAGVFVGHELLVGRSAVLSQLGYYVYYPYDFEGRTYFRIGLKRYLSNKVFAAVTLKSHGAKAEAVEFGIGIRL
jgi:hypothetical protein